MSAIDEAKFDYYRRFPELIVESGDWESYIICDRCRGEVRIDFPGFRGQSSVTGLNHLKCPICGINPPWEFILNASGNNKRNSYGENYLTTKPIPHKVMRRRFHITQKAKYGPFKLWRKQEEIGFWEVEEIK